MNLLRAAHSLSGRIFRPLAHRLLHITPAPPTGPMNLALVIDGENTSPQILPFVLAQLGIYGYASTRRVYANWQQPAMLHWNEACLQYALQPVHQLSLKGKKTTDIALVIDTMDLLYQQEVDGFCLVASDSDYLPLILRLRAAARLVIVFGKPEVPERIQKASSVFIPFPQQAQAMNGKPEQERAQTTPPALPPEPPAAPPQAAPAAKPAAAPVASSNGSQRSLVALFRATYASIAHQDPDGWVTVAVFGHHLKKIDPTFTPKRYGHAQLNKLVKAHPMLFEVQEQGKGQYKIRLRQLRT